MTIGSVYVAVSLSFPGDCKVGFTLRPVPERMAELQRHYRTRHPFAAHCAMTVKNPRRVEMWAHRRLANYRNPRTEIFECRPEIGRAAVLWAVDRVLEEERRYPHVSMPRPGRVMSRRRRARSPSLYWPSIVLLTVGLVAWLATTKPDIPDWVPPRFHHAAEQIERITAP